MKNVQCGTLAASNNLLAVIGNKVLPLQKLMRAIFALTILAVSYAAAAEKGADGPSLFERIGGAQVAKSVVADAWKNHTSNPIIKDRFVNTDPAYFRTKVYELFVASTGGGVEYTGKDMKSAHVGMNISEMEFNAVIDDVLDALDKNGVAQQEKNEVLAILWSVRHSVVNSHVVTKNLKK